jgi:hypothetical protein
VKVASTIELEVNAGTADGQFIVRVVRPVGEGESTTTVQLDAKAYLGAIDDLRRSFWRRRRLAAEFSHRVSSDCAMSVGNYLTHCFPGPYTRRIAPAFRRPISVVNGCR